MYAYDGIHQVRILALTIFNSAFNLCLYKCVFPEENLGALCGLGFQSLPDWMEVFREEFSEVFLPNLVFFSMGFLASIVIKFSESPRLHNQINWNVI